MLNLFNVWIIKQMTQHRGFLYMWEHVYMWQNSFCSSKAKLGVCSQLCTLEGKVNPKSWWIQKNLQVPYSAGWVQTNTSFSTYNSPFAKELRSCPMLKPTKIKKHVNKLFLTSYHTGKIISRHRTEEIPALMDLQQWEDISSLSCQCSNILASLY